MHTDTLTAVIPAAVAHDTEAPIPQASRVSLSWSSSESYLIRLHFGEGNPVWDVSRDILSGIAPTDPMDVTYNGGRLRLMNVATVAMPPQAVAAFVEATRELCPDDTASIAAGIARFEAAL